MTNQQPKTQVPGWFSLIPALKEVQTMAELAALFTVCFEKSNEVLEAEIYLLGGNLDGLQKPERLQSTGAWQSDLVQEQTQILTTFVYRNSLMARLVAVMGGNTDGIEMRGPGKLPNDMLAKLVGTMKEISLQMTTYNQLEQKRLDALRQSLATKAKLNAISESQEENARQRPKPCS